MSNKGKENTSTTRNIGYRLLVGGILRGYFLLWLCCLGHGRLGRSDKFAFVASK
jgi:hypothetical protein